MLFVHLLREHYLISHPARGWAGGSALPCHRSRSGTGESVSVLCTTSCLPVHMGRALLRVLSTDWHGLAQDAAHPGANIRVPSVCPSCCLLSSQAGSSSWKQRREGSSWHIYTFPLLAGAGKGNTQKPAEDAGTWELHLNMHISALPCTSDTTQCWPHCQPLQTAQLGSAAQGRGEVTQPYRLHPQEQPVWLSSMELASPSLPNLRAGHKLPPIAPGTHSPCLGEGAKKATINNLVSAHPCKLFPASHLHVLKCEGLVINARPR